MSNKNIFKDRLDADESIWFERELEYKMAQSKDIELPRIKVRDLLPTNFEVNAGAKTITWEEYESVGIAKWISNYAKDFPTADIKGKENTTKVKGMGSSFRYSIQDIRNARMAGKNLEQRRANSSREAVARKENTAAWFGDDSYNVPGFFSNTNITTGTVAADGVGASTEWEDKTAEQILRDMNDAVLGIIELTNEVEAPNTMILSPRMRGYIATLKIPNSDSTVLSFFLETNEYITDVVSLNECDAANNALYATDIMVVYDRNPDKLEMMIAQDYELFSPQQEMMEFKVPAHEAFGGVVIYKPLAIAIYDGLDT